MILLESHARSDIILIRAICLITLDSRAHAVNMITIITSILFM